MQRLRALWNYMCFRFFSDLLARFYDFCLQRFILEDSNCFLKLVNFIFILLLYFICFCGVLSHDIHLDLLDCQLFVEGCNLSVKATVLIF